MLYFMNDSKFDPDAMVTFGVSAKGKSDAIGYFGTGFKYAVAIILRLGGKVSIESHGDVYEFTVENREIRGSNFGIIMMNGVNAGFTTRLGINWEPWKAFRELWANCMDEDGEVSRTKAEYGTCVTVDSIEMENQFSRKDDFILSGKPLLKCGDIEIYKTPRPYYFYRGFAVADAPDNAIFGYNVLSHVDLTEDRTNRYSHQISFPLAKGVQNLTDRTMLRTILTAPSNSLESGIRYDADFHASDEFIEVARECVSSGLHIPDAAMQVLKSVDEKAGNWPEFLLTDVQSAMLANAIEFLLGIGVKVEMFPVKVVTGLGDGVMGRAINKTIYLSEIPFNQGTKQVASTLLEEWVHNKYGCEDFDRAMQSWLFDKILSIGEELNGRPL